VESDETVFTKQGDSRLGQTRQQTRAQLRAQLHMFKSKSKRFMEGRDLIPCPWQSERFLDPSDAPEIIADSANLKIVGDMTAGRESGREEHQEPAKITTVDVGTDAFH